MRTRCEIRRYSETDRNEVWRVHDEALRESAMDFSPEYNRYLRHVESEFLEIGGEFLVATVAPDAPEYSPEAVDSERVVAIGGFQPLAYLADAYSEVGLPSLDAPVHETCRVRSVAVLPELQSEGIGTELMAELEERASESDFEQVVLKTTESLQRAQQFYESRGYRSVGGSADSGTDYVWYLKEVGD
jgi:ribosomal protein S18 acetylase RimI-like enzyme